MLVRVTHSGICGTDYKIYKGAIPVAYPRIMGHEMVGEVVERRERQRAARRPRDRRSGAVTAAPAFTAASVRRTSARRDRCSAATSIGGFAEYVSAPASQVFPLPPGRGRRGTLR